MADFPPITESPPQPIDSSIANNEGGPIPVQPAPPQSNWTVKGAELRAEYVSGSPFLWLANYIRSLPHWIDDISRDLGIHIYERMMTDPQVNSCIRILTIKILEDGIQLDPAVKADEAQPASQEEDITANLGKDPGRGKSVEERSAEAELAAAICDWCTECLDSMERPLMAVLYEMVEGVFMGGNKVAEEIWELKDDPKDGKTRLYLKNLKCKPRETTAYVVDAYMNLLGLLSMIPGQGWPIQTGTIVGDPKNQPNMMPKEKFFIMTWGGRGSDPRGTSLLRPIYSSWYLKVNTWGEYAKYLTQFASGKYVGKTPPGSQPMPETDSQGNPIPGGALIKPELLMAKTLEDFQNGGIAVFPSGSEIDVHSPQGQGNAIFNSAIDLCNREISHGILCQALATEVGLHGSRAATTSQLSVLDEVIVQERMNMAKALQEQVIKRMVLYNWGREASEKYTPKVRTTQTEARSWSKDAAAVATLVASKFLDPSQYPEIDSQLGLPPRDPKVLAATIEANMAALKAQTAGGGIPGAAPPAPMPPSSMPGGGGGMGTPSGLPTGETMGGSVNPTTEGSL